MLATTPPVYSASAVVRFPVSRASSSIARSRERCNSNATTAHMATMSNTPTALSRRRCGWINTAPWFDL